MSSKFKISIAAAGLVLAVVGLLLINRDFNNDQVTILPISLFVLGVIVPAKVLAKTKHRSTKFKIPKDRDAR